VATRRSTALANPAAPPPATSLASVTDVATAACGPILVASNWWVPSRSTSSSAGSISVSGRLLQAATTAS